MEFTVQGKSGDPIKLKGYWSAINVREGDIWKIKMLTFNMTPPPASAATNNFTQNALLSLFLGIGWRFGQSFANFSAR